MSVTLNTRQIGDVSIVDVSGRITLGEGSSKLRNAIRTMASEGHLHRQFGAGRAGFRPGDSNQPGRETQTDERDRASEGPPPDHEVVHGVRCV